MILSLENISDFFYDILCEGYKQVYKIQRWYYNDNY